MARTKEEIQKRIAELYPAVWVVKTLEDGLAVYQGISEIMSGLETTLDALISSTYIDEAFTNQLDLHGKGRGLPRGENEPDDQYRSRIKGFEDRVTKPALENGMNAILPTGGAYIDEHLKDGGFVDRQVCFVDRRCMIYPDKFNFFTAWVPFQDASMLLDAFVDRQNAFVDRQKAFVENILEPDVSIYKRVYQYLDRNRAAGVRFQMILF